MKNKEQKIISISKQLGLSHIGSNLSCLSVLMEIYEKKKPGDKVLLDCAHSHLAHLMFTCSEDMQENLIKMYGIHCDKHAYCDASGGSLGHALGIGIGMAISFPEHSVYVVVSDGSMMEGSNWEALRIIGDLKLTNLHIYTNFNGFSAVASISGATLMRRMSAFLPFINFRFTKNGKGFEGLAGHYKKI